MPLVSHTAPRPHGPTMAPDDVWTRPCDSDCTPPEVHKIEPFNDKSTANNMKRCSNSSIRVKDVCVCVCVCVSVSLCVCLRGEQHWRLCRWERRDMQRKRDTENGREKEREGVRERGRARKIQGAPVYHVAQSHSYTTSQLHKKKTPRVFDAETVLHKDPFTQHRPPYRTTPKRRLSS